MEGARRKPVRQGNAMQYRKFIIPYAVAIFLIVFVITFSLVCTISHFEISFVVASLDDEAAAIQDSLEEDYSGKSFLFFKEEDVEETVAETGGGYLELTSFWKVFPSTIRMTVVEKYEWLTFEEDGAYCTIDEDGLVLAVKDTAENNIAGDNAVVYGLHFTEKEAGAYLVPDDDSAEMFALLTEIYGYFDEELEGARSNISSIEFDTLGTGSSAYLLVTVRMREGVTVCLVNPGTETESRISETAACYTNLSDLERLRGYIWCTSSETYYSEYSVLDYLDGSD